MAKQIVNRTVSFNVLDPYQHKLNDYCAGLTNFSGHVKRLIQNDYEAQKAKKTPSQPVTNRISVTSLSGIKL